MALAQASMLKHRELMSLVSTPSCLPDPRTKEVLVQVSMLWPTSMSVPLPIPYTYYLLLLAIICLTMV